MSCHDPLHCRAGDRLAARSAAGTISSRGTACGIRVASRFGHLNNGQTTELLQRLDPTRVQWLVGLHLSERNNTPEHVRSTLKPVLEKVRYPLHLATQDVPTQWFELD